MGNQALTLISSKNQPSYAVYQEALVNRIASLTVLAAGIALIFFGLNASYSLVSEISRVFTGALSEKSIVLLCGGAIFTVLGGYGLSRKSKKNY